jgi:sterol 3beta-glucosyltransferase
MSNLLATESMGYVEKVSGMWAGGRKHYGDGEGVVSESRPEGDDEDENEGYGARFRSHFTLPESEKLQATYFGYLHRVLPLYGKIYISNRNFCFRSLLPGTKTKLVLPLKDIENVDKEKGFRFGYSGLVIVIRAFEELFFEFGPADVRDDCAVTLLQNLDSIKFLQESGLLNREDKLEAEVAKAEHRMLQEARMDGHHEKDPRMAKPAESAPHQADAPLILFDDPRASIINFKPTESLRVTCLTIGSRGDVQPYIALCKGLLAEGHKPKIATHAEFEPWVRKHGIDFAPVDGDPAELMRICVENGMFTYSFLKEASNKFRGWIDELLASAWTACQDSDILIESPSAMAGIHIAEALGIPYFRAFAMPWTRTRAYPHAFAVPERKMGGAYNYLTYVMFDNVFWAAIAGQVNRWRKKDLGLRSTSLDKLHPNKVPFLYNFSPSVVVPPLDYSDWIRVTGYWFLDEAAGWVAPKELTDFIAKARADGKKVVYVGFGSIVVSDPAALTKTVVESVVKADVRCILSKGWSDRLGNRDTSEPEVALPPAILQITSAPHDWLFAQIDAAAHHGGAGTTGASLRAGVPTIIKPFFGDQFFFGSRVEDLGVGICLKKLNVSLFSRALWEATHSERMIVKARMLGELIRSVRSVPPFRLSPVPLTAPAGRRRRHGHPSDLPRPRIRAHADQAAQRDVGCGRVRRGELDLHRRRRGPGAGAAHGRVGADEPGAGAGAGPGGGTAAVGVAVELARAGPWVLADGEPGAEGAAGGGRGLTGELGRAGRAGIVARPCRGLDAAGRGCDRGGFCRAWGARRGLFMSITVLSPSSIVPHPRMPLLPQGPDKALADRRSGVF